MNLIEALKETGIVRRKSWLNSKYRVYPDHERRCFKAVDSDGIPYFIDMSFEDIIAEDWEPYKKPCKHEPLNFDMPIIIEKIGKDEFVSLRTFREFAAIATVGNMKCRHCFSPIKATGWELE